MKPQVDPKVDYAFKHLFGREQSEPALISLLDAVLQPEGGQQIESLEVLNPFNEKEALDDKLSILDIKARDQSGRQFNVEMQMFAYGAFRERALYYWARLYQGQLQEGMNYHELRPTIAICFVDTRLFANLPDYHLVFELRERHHAALFTDQLAVHILELRKFNKSIEELATPLDRWLYFLRHAQQLDLEALPGTLDVADVRWALGDLIMITQSERDRERYESRLKAQRDAYALMVEARDAEARGRAEGRAEGRVEGRAEGRAEALTEFHIERIQSFQRLLRRNIASQEELRSLPSEDLENLAAGLETELKTKLSDGNE